jgi:peptidyl-prolyl cis-trans isomerase A (cyclophilin A)
MQKKIWIISILLLLLNLFQTTAANDQPILVQCETTKGSIEIQLEPKWSPIGVKHFLFLLNNSFFAQKIPLFRCVEEFLCQFGYVPNKNQEIFERTIQDDSRTLLKPFQKGFLSYAGNGENSRSSHFFISFTDEAESLGTEPWETPLGFVKEPSLTNVVMKFNTEYGEMHPW